MKQQSLKTSIALATLVLVGVLMIASATPALAAGPTVGPATNATGDWLEVVVGFGMLLAVGLGGLWFTQHQMKFR